MLKNHLLILLRNLGNNRLFVFINILGLSIAIGCCVVAYFNVEFNSSFDDNHTNSESIYRVNSIREYQGAATAYGLVPLPLGEVIRQNVKDVEMISRASFTWMNMRLGNEVFSSSSCYVDPDFFRMFTFSFLHGSATAMTDKHKIVISDRLAVQYFGSENAIGKVVTQLLQNDVIKEYEIVGVFKLPKENSSFDEDIYALIDNYWDVSPELFNGTNWKLRNTLFVFIADRARVAEVERQINPYAQNNNKVREDFIIKEFRLDPLAGMAVRDVKAKRPGTNTRDASPMSAVIGCAVMAILVLLIACFNLANTSMALSSKRLKEIGIRKVMGSARHQLILQYIGETLVICFTALIVGLLLAESFLLPAFNMLWPYMKLNPNYLDKPSFLIFISMVLVFTGVLAGAYPAFYVSKFNPVKILKGKVEFGGNNFVTHSFLWVQLMLSLAGIICSLAFIGNARFQRDYNYGFNKDGVIFTMVEGRSAYENYRNALAGNTDILSIAAAPNHVNTSYYNDPVKHEGVEIESNLMDVGDNYLKTVGLKLVEGRDFVKDSETDRRESVIVTEELVRKFGWDKPLGKEIIWMDTVKLYVIGVVNDIVSLWDPIEPMMIRYASPERVNYFVVNARADKVEDVNAFMEKKWKEIFPNRVYSPRYLNEGVMEANMVNNNILIMFFFQGVVALLLSITGLYTLVSLNIIKRMKEIGVRKVLGASVFTLARMINSRFLLILVLACAGGSFVGMSMADVLMGSIWEHHQSPTILTAVVSCVALFIACILSVCVKTYQTANVNPADILRNE